MFTSSSLDLLAKAVLLDKILSLKRSKQHVHSLSESQSSRALMTGAYEFWVSSGSNCDKAKRFLNIENSILVSLSRIYRKTRRKNWQAVFWFKAKRILTTTKNPAPQTCHVQLGDKQNLFLLLTYLSTSSLFIFWTLSQFSVVGSSLVAIAITR